MDGAAHLIQLEVITPDEQVYSGNVRFLLARATDGDLGILPGHAPLVASLSIWPVQFDDPEGNRHAMAVFGGFMEVLPEKITIVTPNCELPEEIDVARAERAKKRAEERLASKNADIDHLRAELALKRALMRLQVTKK